MASRSLIMAAALLLAAAPAERGRAAEPAWVEADPAMMTPLGFTAGQLDGVTLYGENGQALGEIERVFMTRSGLVAGLAVEIGEVLGLGGREVILRFDQVRREGNVVTTLLSRAQLEAQPRWGE